MIAGAGGGFGERHNRAPDLIERVVGYRTFALKHKGTWFPRRHALGGQFICVTWQPGWNVAECRWEEYVRRNDVNGEPVDVHPEWTQYHEVPDGRCACGFYAYYEPPTAPRNDVVSAVIEVKGRILAHEHGMRAEMARIVALAVPPASDKTRNQEAIRHVGRAAKCYSVPVISRSELAAFGARHGHAVPISMRPGKKWLADGGGAGESSIAA